jgi:hypothetical protein
MPSRFPARITLLRLAVAVALAALTVPLAVVGGYTVASAHEDGVTLHVSAAHGSDDNPCRRLAPCATIGGAVAAARPGDTIEVAAGTYHEDVAVTIRHFGVWVLSAAPVSAGANRFENVAVPVFQQ